MMGHSDARHAVRSDCTRSVMDGMSIGAGTAAVAWGVPDTAETIESAMSGDDDMV